MEHLNLINIALLLFGVAISSLIRMEEARKKGKLKGGWSLGKWWADNGLITLIALLMGLVLLSVADEAWGMLGLAADDELPYIKFYSFICGYTPKSLLQRFEKHITG
jgi:hypothetical protein